MLLQLVLWYRYKFIKVICSRLLQILSIFFELSHMINKKCMNSHLDSQSTCLGLIYVIICLKLLSIFGIGVSEHQEMKLKVVKTGEWTGGIYINSTTYRFQYWSRNTTTLNKLFKKSHRTYTFGAFWTFSTLDSSSLQWATFYTMHKHD